MSGKWNASSLKLVAWDLDDTLLDTSQILIPIRATPEFEKRIAMPLPLLPGALENLERVSRFSEQVLVTQGNPVFQMQKLKSLGIEKYFSHCFFVDPKSSSKELAFSELAKKTQLTPKSWLSIGNRPSTDLKQPKILGAWTCHFAHGEHQDERPQSPFENPDFKVLNHFELAEILHR